MEEKEEEKEESMESYVLQLNILKYIRQKNIPKDSPNIQRYVYTQAQNVTPEYGYSYTARE